MLGTLSACSQTAPCEGRTPVVQATGADDHKAQRLRSMQRWGKHSCAGDMSHNLQQDVLFLKETCAASTGYIYTPSLSSLPWTLDAFLHVAFLSVMSRHVGPRILKSRT